MMKRLWIIGACFLAIALVGCKGTTYSKLLKEEKKQIKNYISSQGIRVLDEMPEVWGEKDYYAIPGYDNIYIHIITDEMDSTSKPAELGAEIVLRYKKYSLKAYSDTIRYWTTDDGGAPIEFQLGNSADPFYCAGWTLAIQTMKYSGGHCYLICPSKLGFVEDNSSVTPYGYELKFKIKNH